MGTIPMSLLTLDTIHHDDMDWVDVVRTGFLGDFAGEPLLPFADWIEIQASVIRLKGSPTAAWLAAKVDELASWARRLKAATPDDFDARFELEDEASRTTIWVDGWDAAERNRQGELFA